MFRAATTACFAAAAGARLVPVADLDAAFDLKARHSDWLLAGERSPGGP